MINNQLESFLKNTLSDTLLDNSEKNQLKEIIQTLSLDEVRFMRNKAFELTKIEISQSPQQSQSILKWLENVIKTIDVTPTQAPVIESAYFTPGNECKNHIINKLNSARDSVAICVFTIADDQITDTIIKTHQRGVKVRIITDNDKSHDDGSDVAYLKRSGVNVFMDYSPYHMHHKFAIFDQSQLLTGSFNWTRSASQNNYENILVTANNHLILSFSREFERLWQQFR